jgi:TonB family protein
MRARPFLTATLLILASAGTARADRGASPPPVILSHPPIGDRPVEQTILGSPDAQVTCDGAPVTPTWREDLAPISLWQAPDAGSEMSLAFTIDDDGRTRDIRTTRPFGGADDDAIQASLAAWRFPAQAAKDCRLTVRWRTTRLDKAETSDLLRYFAVTRTTGPLRDAVARKLGGPGADCDRRGRPPRLMAFPDFKAGRRPPSGGRTWTVVRWNVDEEGRATDVETLGSSGDADLDAEGRRAVGETLLRPGPPLTGCVYNFYRVGETLPAPPIPPERDDPLQKCPDEIGDRFTARPNPDFPESFRQRAVEGWALVRFDIATWGEIGNVEVVEAQPAAVFGEQARRLVQSSRATPAFDAGVRCVVPVRYRLPADATQDETGQD